MPRGFEELEEAPQIGIRDRDGRAMDRRKPILASFHLVLEEIAGQAHVHGPGRPLFARSSAMAMSSLSRSALLAIQAALATGAAAAA